MAELTVTKEAGGISEFFMAEHTFAKDAELEVNSIYELRTCPYNPAHKVGVNRFPQHLVKCAKQYPDKAKNYEHCFANWSHMVLKGQMSHHKMVCPDYLDWMSYKQKKMESEAKMMEKMGKKKKGDVSYLLEIYKEEGETEEEKNKKKLQGDPNLQNKGQAELGEQKEERQADPGPPGEH